MTVDVCICSCVYMPFAHSVTVLMMCELRMNKTPQYRHPKLLSA